MLALHHAISAVAASGRAGMCAVNVPPCVNRVFATPVS